MKHTYFFIFLFLFFSIISLPTSSYSVDEQVFSYQLFYAWDLRNRETFIQVTSVDSSDIDIHFQIFDSTNLCNELDFYDTLSTGDGTTHIYNMSNITTNNGDPSGVVLPSNSFGFVAITVVNATTGLSVNNPTLFGNLRIVDNSGFEYRSNSIPFPTSDDPFNANFLFGFKELTPTSFSDLMIFGVTDVGPGKFGVSAGSNIGDIFDLSIYNNEEVVFSCANVVLKCTEANTAFGINTRIPNEYNPGNGLCLGNGLSEGFVKFTFDPEFFDDFATSEGIDTRARFIFGFKGINNNGNRGSMEVINAIPGPVF